VATPFQTTVLAEEGWKADLYLCAVVNRIRLSQQVDKNELGGKNHEVSTSWEKCYPFWEKSCPLFIGNRFTPTSEISLHIT